jgi:anti-anti-sigma factor
MTVIPITRDGILVLTLTGRFDTAGAPAVQQALDAHFHERPKAVVLDLSGVEFISSAGIRVLLITAKEAAARKGVLALAGLRPYCRDLLASLPLAGGWKVFETLDQAESVCARE